MTTLKDYNMPYISDDTKLDTVIQLLVSVITQIRSEDTSESNNICDILNMISTKFTDKPSINNDGKKEIVKISLPINKIEDIPYKMKYLKYKAKYIDLKLSRGTAN